MNDFFELVREGERYGMDEAERAKMHKILDGFLSSRKPCGPLYTVSDASPSGCACRYPAAAESMSTDGCVIHRTAYVVGDRGKLSLFVPADMRDAQQLDVGDVIRILSKEYNSCCRFIVVAHHAPNLSATPRPCDNICVREAESLTRNMHTSYDDSEPHRTAMSRIPKATSARMMHDEFMGLYQDPQALNDFLRVV